MNGRNSNMENIDIKIKSSLNILGFASNKIVGSNKSKAKISIFDKIKKFYFSKKYEHALNKISKLEEEKEKKISERDHKMFEAALNSDNNEKISSMGASTKLYEDQMNEKIDKMKKIAIDSAIELDKINNLPVEENEVNNDSMSVDEEEINNQISQIESKISNDVKNIEDDSDNYKSENESVDNVEQKPIKDDKVDESKVQKNDLDAQAEQVMNLLKPIILETIKEKEMNIRKADLEKFKIYTEKVDEKVNKIVDRYSNQVNMEKEKSRQLEQKIQSMKSVHEQDTANIKNELEQTKSELNRTNDMNRRYFETIEEQNKQIEEQHQNIASLQDASNSKDQEIAALKAEINRLSAYEQSVNMLRGVMANNMPMDQQVENQNGKTL